MKLRNILSCLIILTLLSSCTSTQTPTPPAPVTDVPPASHVTDVPPGGSYAGNADYLFYIDPNDGDSLYRMSNDTKEVICLDDSECQSLFIDDTYIYYESRLKDISLRTSSWGSICKISFEGTDKTELVEEGSLIGLTDERIIFRDSVNQYYWSIKKDGSDKTLLPSRESYYSEVSSGYVFISDLSDDDCRGLYRIDIDSRNVLKLTDDYATWTNVSGNKLYYNCSSSVNNQQYLVSMDLDGSNRQIISEGHFGRLIVDGDWIYYADYDAMPRTLCKIRTDGTQKTVLYIPEEDSITNIEKVGDRIFLETYNIEENEEFHYCMDTDGNLLS